MTLNKDLNSKIKKASMFSMPFERLQIPVSLNAFHLTAALNIETDELFFKQIVEQAVRPEAYVCDCLRQLLVVLLAHLQHQQQIFRSIDVLHL